MAGYNLSGKQYNAFDLASLYLRTAGLPDTPLNRRILASWFMAESKRVGPSDIMVYNNNPLNYTCTTCTDYHQFGGNSLKFANYSSPAAGASAWANAIHRPIYAPINAAFKAQDWAGLAYALRTTPWGTSPMTFTNVFKSTPKDLSTGADLGTIGGHGAGGSWDPTGGSPITTMLKRYIADHGIDPNSQITEGEWNNFLAWEQEQTGIDISGEFPYSKFQGMTWSDAIGGFSKFGVPNPSTNPLDTIAGALNNLSFWTDPAKGADRLFHIVGLLAGAAVFWLGLKTVLNSADVTGEGGGDVIVENAGGGSEKVVERYPVIIDKGDVPTVASPPPAQRMIRRRRKTSSPTQFDEYIDNTAEIPASETFAPPRKASA